MELALPVREAVVTALKASAGVTARIPAASIYGERVPDDRTYPFIRMGVPSALPFAMACYPNGEREEFMVHAFVKGPASDNAALAGAAIKVELNNAVLGGHSLKWMGSQLLMDPEEPDTWHAINVFEAV